MRRIFIFAPLPQLRLMVDRHTLPMSSSFGDIPFRICVAFVVPQGDTFNVIDACKRRGCGDWDKQWCANPCKPRPPGGCAQRHEPEWEAELAAQSMAMQRAVFGSGSLERNDWSLWQHVMKSANHPTTSTSSAPPNPSSTCDTSSHTTARSTEPNASIQRNTTCLAPADSASDTSTSLAGLRLRHRTAVHCWMKQPVRPGELGDCATCHRLDAARLRAQLLSESLSQHPAVCGTAQFEECIPTMARPICGIIALGGPCIPALAVRSRSRSRFRFRVLWPGSFMRRRYAGNRSVYSAPGASVSHSNLLHRIHVQSMQITATGATVYTSTSTEPNIASSATSASTASHTTSGLPTRLNISLQPSSLRMGAGVTERSKWQPPTQSCYSLYGPWPCEQRATGGGPSVGFAPLWSTQDQTNVRTTKSHHLFPTPAPVLRASIQQHGHNEGSQRIAVQHTDNQPVGITSTSPFRYRPASQVVNDSLKWGQRAISLVDAGRQPIAYRCGYHCGIHPYPTLVTPALAHRAHPGHAVVCGPDNVSIRADNGPALHHRNLRHIANSNVRQLTSTPQLHVAAIAVLALRPRGPSHFMPSHIGGGLTMAAATADMHRGGRGGGGRPTNQHISLFDSVSPGSSTTHIPASCWLSGRPGSPDESNVGVDTLFGEDTPYGLTEDVEGVNLDLLRD